MGRHITVALAGNPNSGKTTVFNNLTGARQHVGNYPGVTVEKKEGRCCHDGIDITVVDLPGTYSLTAYTAEELVARELLISDRPDVVVDIVDASNLERNLYLAVQLIELGVPLVLALNMSDVAKARGVEFELEALSRLLGAPIVPTVGHRNRGMKELLGVVVDVALGRTSYQRPRVLYGREIEEEISRLEQCIERHEQVPETVTPRWLAVKLLEGDPEVVRTLNSEQVQSTVEHSVQHLKRICGDSPAILIPDRRYGFISGACQEAVRATVEARHVRSDRIDAVLLNRVLGLPVFLVLMYLVFQLTFTVGAMPMGWLESGFSWLAHWLTAAWPLASGGPLQSLVVDGIIGGVGGVIVFLPNIMLLFLAIAVLEDSGYMARAAFIMDQLMHRIGLHGKSFIPMLIGFGCSVPGIMATRTLENERDRLTTILVVPLMSCGARLPIYALLIPAFFPVRWHGPMLWLIYVIGIAVAILAAKALRGSLLKGETAPFVMELPPYRWPTLRGAAVHTWERSWLYLKKAGTIILGLSIVLWFISSYPKPKAYSQDYGARRRAAEAQYSSRLRQLSTALGLVPDSGVLERALNPVARGSGELTTAAAGSTDIVAERFVELCLKVEDTERRFRDTVAESGAADGNPTWLALAHHRDTELAELEAADSVVYSAVRRYVEDIRPSLVSELDEIEAQQQAEIMAYSAAGRLGRALEPLLKPLGFDWRIGTALIGALAAKEVFVAQLGIVYAVGDADERWEALRAHLREDYTPLVGFCIMIFCLISAPCMATIAVCRRESGSWRWALLQLGGLTALAYVLTLIIYQSGRALGVGL